MLDGITGKKTAEEVKKFHDKMESVYEAMATRMIEVLDKEERLEIRQRELSILSSQANLKMEKLDKQLRETEYNNLVQIQQHFNSTTNDKVYKLEIENLHLSAKIKNNTIWLLSLSLATVIFGIWVVTAL